MSGDTGYAPERWEFDAKVTDAFDDMLRRSIPQYDVMRSVVTDLACAYAKPGSAIVDLGCSRGEALAPIVDRLGAAYHYVGAEISEPMLAACKARFADEIAASTISIQRCDLRTDFPRGISASVVLAVLCLQFVPIEYRQGIVSKAYEALKPGGALIVVEKVLGATSALDARMVELYLLDKRDKGYSQDAIDRKRLSLEGVLVPIAARWNEDLLRSAGFAEVDCVWRWLNFAAWVAVRRDR